ncbi:PREDICTED: transcription factor HES-5-like [Priapulus caudatus]|uniref:Transcription factor HES-5-like n=1 Tax=Priapulus caudatus TaxID=37621 RepID=A0ABM1EU00_PRICU|nr:PREDICTED: transcription factor HES-5-like [Priapulus caudatus]
MYPKPAHLASEHMPKLSKDRRRKIFKPIVEKKRRDRINSCLDDLKELLRQQGMRKEGMCYSKVEKADILEMAVEYLHAIRSQQITVMASRPELAMKYQAGYTECAAAVSQFMGLSGLSPELGTRVMGHLSGVITNRSPLPPSPTSLPSSPTSLPPTSAPSVRSAYSGSARLPLATKRDVMKTGSGERGFSAVAITAGPPVLLCKPVPIIPELIANPVYANPYKSMLPMWRPW